MNIILSILIPTAVSVVVNTIYKAMSDKKAYEMQRKIEDLERQMKRVVNGLEELINTLDDIHIFLSRGMRNDR